MNSRAISEIFSFLPQNVSLFLYSINGTVAFFGVLAVIGIAIAGIALVRAAELSRNQAELAALHQTFGFWKKKTNAFTKLFPKLLPRLRSPRLGLSWKIAGALAGMMFFTGLLLIAVVYRSVVTIILDQAERRSRTIATNLGDSAAPYISAKNSAKNSATLHALLRKYAALENVAFAFIEDKKGTVLATTSGSPPPKLQDYSVVDELRSKDWPMISFEGQLIYDTRAPILDGRLGTAHVGIWKHAIDDHIRQVAYPLIRLILIVFMIGVSILFCLIIYLIRPILRLTETARQMSRGDLDRAAGFNSRDEIGDLARSLERMRSSLKAAMSRLNAGPSAGE
jgi:HAMP domain-containing protein